MGGSHTGWTDVLVALLISFFRSVLQPGVHTLFIDATTNDSLYHAGAWYRFDLTFVPV